MYARVRARAQLPGRLPSPFRPHILFWFHLVVYVGHNPFQMQDRAIQQAQAQQHGAAHDTLRLEVEERIRVGMQRRDESFLKEMFARKCAQQGTEPFISRGNLSEVLQEVGIEVSVKETEVLFDEFDTDSNNGLDETEFIALVSKPTVSDEWARSLPLCELLADSIPREVGVHPLRTLSCLGAETIQVACECFSRALQQILMQRQADLRRAFQASDSNTKADFRDSKFSIVPVSCGNVHDYHRGLQERIGKSALRRLWLHLLT